MQPSEKTSISSRPVAPGWIRVCLALLALTTLITGAWALFAPLSFFTTFPAPGHPWVALLPPYNEHLVRDVGAFNLGFALLFIWTTISPERRLLQAVLWAWLVYAVPHLIYHLNHLMQFALVDQIGQIIALGFVILLPLLLLVALFWLPSRHTQPI
jgi:hypothetical protein